MVSRKHNSTAGFSLIEVLVAITILGFVVVPIGSSLVLSFRLNARSEQMLQAQLAVSSAVETIMAEGYETDHDYNAEYDGFDVVVTGSNSCEDENGNEQTTVAFHITVSAIDEANNELLTVETFARPKGGGT